VEVCEDLHNCGKGGLGECYRGWQIEQGGRGRRSPVEPAGKVLTQQHVTCVVKAIANFNNTGTKGVETVVLPYASSYRNTAPVDEWGTYVAIEVVVHLRRGNLGPQVVWAETSRLGCPIASSRHPGLLLIHTHHVLGAI
jgi:hypothetical protein